MRTPKLTFILLEPGVFSKPQGALQCSCLSSFGTNDVFQSVFFVSQQQHYFLEGVAWCHKLHHLSHVTEICRLTTMASWAT